jgi:hypothetical protein
MLESKSTQNQEILTKIEGLVDQIEADQELTLKEKSQKLNRLLDRVVVDCIILPSQLIDRINSFINTNSEFCLVKPTVCNIKYELDYMLHRLSLERLCEFKVKIESEIVTLAQDKSVKKSIIDAKIHTKVIIQKRIAEIKSNPEHTSSPKPQNRKTKRNR